MFTYQNIILNYCVLKQQQREILVVQGLYILGILRTVARCQIIRFSRLKNLDFVLVVVAVTAVLFFFGYFCTLFSAPIFEALKCVHVSLNLFSPSTAVLEKAAM